MRAYINRKAKELSKNAPTRTKRETLVVGDFSPDWLKTKSDRTNGVSDLLKQIDGTVRMKKALLEQQYHDNPKAFIQAISDKT